MPITKAAGNMYDWITHTHSHLRGACPHACPYCYVQTIDHRFKSTHHQGPVRLEARELKVNYGTGKTIFIEHTNDLFANKMPYTLIRVILHHTCLYPENTYVFQTKNPLGMLHLIPQMPPKNIVGVTIESDITHVGTTPHPIKRMLAFNRNVGPSFITIEPVLKFSPVFAAAIIGLRPDFINIGADSKATPGLPEPTPDELRGLLSALQSSGIQIRTKRNLARLLTA